MAGAQDLHQIEYRHHQTDDLSPFASSVTTRESLAGWDSLIRAWVRHPYSDVLSESACYQVFPNGQAALAWRYWDERAANRQDGTLGRPLVSRVLVGSKSVLRPGVALALCRAGLSAEWVGWLPGEMPDGRELPMVSGRTLIDLARETAPVLDQASADQKGLQAVVAAVLAEPTVPLAISVPDAFIQAPLRECVQCPLLWGLRRIVRPLLGPADRIWSFSTFELPLGKTDPASLPEIVFRRAQVGTAGTPPSRFRREAKVRPFEDRALDDRVPYAGMVEQAGLLVAGYRELGGDELSKLIEECVGSRGSLTSRIRKVTDALRKDQQPSGAPGQGSFGWFQDTRPRTGTPEQEDAQSVDSPLAESPTAVSPAAESPAMAPAVASPASMSEEPQSGAGVAQSDVTGLGDSSPEAPQGGDSQAGEDGVAEPRYSEPVKPLTVTSPAATPTAFSDGSTYADPGQGEDRGGAEPVPVDAGDAALALHAVQAESDSPAVPLDQEYADSLRRRHQPPLNPHASPGDRQVMSRSGAPVSPQSMPGGASNLSRINQMSLSSQLKQLEWLGENQTQFNSILNGMYRTYRAGSIAPEELVRSWQVISSNDWYDNICRSNDFRSRDLEIIFITVVIPGLADQFSAAEIAQWALQAPRPMVQGLLAAARSSGAETWHTVMGFLEPALAYRWTAENFMQDCWDSSRVIRSYPGHLPAASRRGQTGTFRWLNIFRWFRREPQR